MNNFGFENLSLLFVEDDSVSREMLEYFLKRQSFKEVYIAQNGVEGLEQYFLHKPDIVLTDLNMPLMNGLELSAKIKEDNPEVPILLITTQIEKEVTEKAVDIGIEGFLFKPIALERLQLLIATYSQRVLVNKSLKNKHKLLEEYKRAIDFSSAVTKTDKFGTIVYANQAFCELSGYTQEEILGKNHNIIRHPKQEAAIYKDMWETITTKEVWKGRLRNRRKDGATYYEYLVIIPILDEEDKVVEYIALRQDITDVVEQEEYLKKQIKKEVKKNLELHKKREEENLLEAKFSTIGRMAAGITHEINTPLTYIRGNLELIMDDINDLDAKVPQKISLQEDLKTVLDGVNRIANIVESMREMASATNELPSISNIYSSLITALTLSHNKAKQISKIYLQDELFTIGMNKDKFIYNGFIQKQRIEQVFIIIINNALDALLHKENFYQRSLQISVNNEYDFVVIRFKDNAGGIAPDILPTIFEPFSSNKAEGGMGIGLNVAKKIVDDHGGKIIPSNDEDGALFEVYLPKDEGSHFVL